MPQTLKPAAATALIELLRPIQDEYAQSVEWQELATKAYPLPEQKKKEKKVKDRGTRFPGIANQVEVKPDGHVEGKANDEANLANGAEEAMNNLHLTSNAIK